jgi:hypothetical protein
MFGNFRSGRAAGNSKKGRGRQPSGRGDRLATGRSRIPVFELLEQRAMLSGNTYTPSTTIADSTVLTDNNLRSAIAAANADTGTATDVIQLSAGTYSLSLNELHITSTAHTLIIEGQGWNVSNPTIVDQTNPTGDVDRVFQVDAGVTVIFENLAIGGGMAENDGSTQASAFGGGILNAGTLTLDDVELAENAAVAQTPGAEAAGGGIYSTGALTIENGSLIAENGAAGANGAVDAPGGPGDGGGVYASSADPVTITDSGIDDNTAKSGNGGDGSTAGEIVPSGFSGASGGGVFIASEAASPDVFDDDTFAGNNAIGSNGGAGATSSNGGDGGWGVGGGVAAFQHSPVTISNSTLSGNTAQGGNGGNAGTGTGTMAGPGGSSVGGGAEIFTDPGSELLNDTVYGNNATGASGSTSGDATGGGISDDSGGQTLVNVTVTANIASVVAPAANGTPGEAAGGGIWAGSALEMQNSLVAGNMALDNTGTNIGADGPDYSGTVTNSDSNLIGDATDSSGFSTSNGDQLGTTMNPIDPLFALAGLTNNGGNNDTVALQLGSPALGKGDVGVTIANSLANDQRGAGFPRVVAGKTDIGALETQLQTPVVTNATTTENTQTTTGLVITPATADAAIVTNFQITGITGGTLFQSDGTTAIANGDFITVAQGAAGLKFTPTTGSLAPGAFVVQESTSGTTLGLGGTTATAAITVTLAGPTVTDASTTENTQTTSGLVITPGTHDGTAAFLQITGITGGTLFQHDGSTAIANGDFITLAQGAAGLKFTPTSGTVGTGSFVAQESTSSSIGGLNGPTATGTIAIAFAGPTVTDAATNENTQTTSGLVITPGTDDTTATFFQVTGISGGTLFQHDGTTAIANGDFITAGQGAAGLKFTPTTNSTAPGSFVVQESASSSAGGLSGPKATATITVGLSGPSVTDAATTENTQTTSGLVITPGAGDATATNFQITGITGGTLFQHDGTTAIANGSFITLAQGAAGLTFTPTTGSLATGSFVVQESTTSGASGLSGAKATATITVAWAGPSVTSAATTIDTQTTSGLVITPGPHDSTAAFFQITALSGGTLFQADGTTAIASGDFITLAQGAAGLKFTPTSGSLATGSLTVRESSSSATSGLSGPTATASIAVTLPTSTVVDLSSDYNLTGITTAGTHFGGGLDARGNALVESLVGASITWNGLSFPIGAANVNDVVQGAGQSITLPAGSYGGLQLLAAGTNGNQAAETFTIKYTDGSSATVTQSISDWHMPQNYAGEAIALATGYRNTSGGGTDDRGPFDVFGYSLALDSTKTVESIMLPDDSHVKILSMLVTAPVDAPSALAATSTAGSGVVNLTWTGATGTISGYQVLRGTTSGSEAAAPIASLPPGSVSYADSTGLVVGNTYYYTLKAINAGAPSAASNEASATLSNTATATQVDLAGEYNLLGIAADGDHFADGLDFGGNALSANVLGTSQTVGGVTFALGPAGVSNVIRAAGQTIGLPSGSYTKVQLLATGVNGNQPDQTFTINYSSGSPTTVTQSISDWAGTTAGKTATSYAGQSVAVTSGYRNTAGGGRDSRGPFDVYAYTFAVTVPAGAHITSITLPDNNNVEVLAITLTN